MATKSTKPKAAEAAPSPAEAAAPISTGPKIVFALPGALTIDGETVTLVEIFQGSAEPMISENAQAIADAIAATFQGKCNEREEAHSRRRLMVEQSAGAITAAAAAFKSAVEQINQGIGTVGETVATLGIDLGMIAEEAEKDERQRKREFIEAQQKKLADELAAVS